LRDEDTFKPIGALANILLHEVLDVWFEREVKPRLHGRAFLIRFADDFAMLFEHEQDVRRVLEVLPKRFGKYGLRLQPQKTRLVPFQRPTDKGGPNSPGPGTFDLLGFTHFWGRSRKGVWVVKRRTARSRFGRTLRRIAEWCRVHRHQPVAKQHAALNRKLKGHDAYYGITGNCSALGRLRHWVERIWRKWLSSRSQHGRLSWKRMRALLRVFPLARPRVVHSALPRAAKP
jgi:RNA-directed DNA polymerase